MRILCLLLLYLFVGTITHAQDVIVKRDGKEITCNIIELGDSLIEYTSYKKQEGPYYQIYIDEIKMVINENGDTLSFDDPIPQKELHLGEKIYYSSGFWGLNIYQEGYKLSKSDAFLLFQNSSTSLESYKKGKNKIIIGNVVLIPSVIALGYELGSLIISGEANYIVMAIAAGGSIGGIVIKISGNRSIKNAVDHYNNGLEASVKAIFNLGKTQNGLGIVCSF